MREGLGELLEDAVKRLAKEKMDAIYREMKFWNEIADLMREKDG